MTKIVIAADIHVDCYPGGAPREDGANGRLANIIDALNGLLAASVKMDADAIIIAGDTIHDRKAVKQEALDALGQWMDAVNDAKIPLHLLVGNHDLSSAGVRVSGLRAFSGRAASYDRRTIIDLAGVKVGMIPYTEDPEQVRSHAAALEKAKCRLVFGHLGLGDPKVQNATPMDYEVPGRIALSDLRPSAFEHVFLGHYHRAQDMGNTRYVGSLLQLSLKEAGERKRFLVWNDGVVEDFENTFSPRYRLVSTAAEAKSAPAQDFVVFRPKTKADEAEALEMAKGRPMRVERAPVVATTRVRIDAGASDAKMVRSYVDAVTASDADRATLAKVGMEILNG